MKAIEQKFMTTVEVADFLRVKPKTLQCYASRHPVYRADRPGIYHVEHVNILEKVWIGIWSQDEGAAFWELEKDRMAKSPKRGR